MSPRCTLHFFFMATAIFAVLSTLSCASQTVAAPVDVLASRKTASPKAVKTKNAKPLVLKGTNENVLVLEYHKVLPQEARWDRSIDRFCKDLHSLYKRGFRPVTMAEYIRGELNSTHYQPQSDHWWDSPILNLLDAPTVKGLPRGMKPVIITFDDSHASQFRLKKDGTIDPDCAVGIWARFAKKYPDFPVKATFFVLPTMMWGQHKWLPKKLEMLKEWGCELGSHTMSHRSLGKLTDEQVKKEFAMSILYIEKLGFKPETIALPYGVAPKNGALLKGFKYWGRNFGFRAAVLGGAGPAPMPDNKRFRAYHIPRTQGINGLLGINYWLKRVDWGTIRMHKSK